MSKNINVDINVNKHVCFFSLNTDFSPDITESNRQLDSNKHYFLTSFWIEWEVEGQKWPIQF